MTRTLNREVICRFFAYKRMKNNTSYTLV